MWPSFQTHGAFCECSGLANRLSTSRLSQPAAHLCTSTFAIPMIYQCVPLRFVMRGTFSLGGATFARSPLCRYGNWRQGGWLCGCVVDLQSASPQIGLRKIFACFMSVLTCCQASHFCSADASFNAVTWGRVVICLLQASYIQSHRVVTTNLVYCPIPH